MDALFWKCVASFVLVVALAISLFLVAFVLVVGKLEREEEKRLREIYWEWMGGQDVEQRL